MTRDFRDLGVPDLSMFLCTDGGGLCHTPDFTMVNPVWTQYNDGLPTPYITQACYTREGDTPIVLGIVRQSGSSSMWAHVYKLRVMDEPTTWKWNPSLTYNKIKTMVPSNSSYEFSINAIARDPCHPNRIYLYVTQKVNISYTSVYIFVSEDFGNSWRSHFVSIDYKYQAFGNLLVYDGRIFYTLFSGGAGPIGGAVYEVRHVGGGLSNPELIAANGESGIFTPYIEPINMRHNELYLTSWLGGGLYAFSTVRPDETGAWGHSPLTGAEGNGKLLPRIVVATELDHTYLLVSNTDGLQYTTNSWATWTDYPFCKDWTSGIEYPLQSLSDGTWVAMAEAAVAGASTGYHVVALVTGFNQSVWGKAGVDPLTNSSGTSIYKGWPPSRDGAWFGSPQPWVMGTHQEPSIGAVPLPGDRAVWDVQQFPGWHTIEHSMGDAYMHLPTPTSHTLASWSSVVNTGGLWLPMVSPTIVTNVSCSTYASVDKVDLDVFALYVTASINTVTTQVNTMYPYLGAVGNTVSTIYPKVNTIVTQVNTVQVNLNAVRNTLTTTYPQVNTLNVQMNTVSKGTAEGQAAVTGPSPYLASYKSSPVWSARHTFSAGIELPNGQSIGITGGPLLTVSSAGIFVFSGCWLGVGVETPAAKIHAFSSTEDTHIRSESTFEGGDARLELIANSAGVSQIRFGDEASLNIGLITYDHANDSLAFRANNLVIMTLTAGGDVGVGVVPSYRFHVQKDQNAITRIAAENDTNGTAARAGVSVIAANVSGLFEAFNSGYTTSGSAIADSVRVYAGADASGGLQLVAAAATEMGFWTSNTRRMTIDASGALFLHALGAATTGTDLVLTAGLEVRPKTSSFRDKENICNLVFDLNVVDLLRPIMFDYKEGSKRVWGFGAEELFGVIPEAVNLDNDGLPYSIRNDALIAMLIAEVQDLRRRALR